MTREAGVLARSSATSLARCCCVTATAVPMCPKPRHPGGRVTQKARNFSGRGHLPRRRPRTAAAALAVVPGAVAGCDGGRCRTVFRKLSTWVSRSAGAVARPWVCPACSNDPHVCPVQPKVATSGLRLRVIFGGPELPCGPLPGPGRGLRSCVTALAARVASRPAGRHRAESPGQGSWPGGRSALPAADRVARRWVIGRMPDARRTTKRCR